MGGPRSQVAAKAEPAPPKSSKPGDSLLGLDDFFGPPQQAAPRTDLVNSNAGSGTNSSRPDLKTSILSLYSSTPKQLVRPQGHQSTTSFGNSVSPHMPQSAITDLDDAFSGLNFSSQSQPQPSQPQKPNAFANLASLTRSPPVAPQVTPAQSGGFFGAPSVKKPVNQASTTASSGLNDLFILSSQPQTQPIVAKPTTFPVLDNTWSSPSPAAPVQTQANVWGASNNSIASNAYAGLGTSSLANGKNNGKNNDDDFGSFATSKVDDDLFANVWK